MSLIMDALKQAQELRLKGSKEIPMLKYPHSVKKRVGIANKQWILVGAGLVFFCGVLFTLIKPGPPPQATQSNQSFVFMEKKPTVPVMEEIVTEPPSNVSIPLKNEEPSLTAQTLNRINISQTDKEETLSIEATLKGQPFPVSKRPLTPSPSPSQQGESPSKSFGVEQEGEKGQPLTSEALNHFNSGVHFYKQGEFLKAIQAYQKVIEVDPAYIEAYNNLGILYQMLGDMDRALGFYQKSIEINPRYEKGYNNLGTLLFLKGRYEEAQEAFQNALTINSNNIESHINLGILFKKKDQWEKAIESYQKALAINPLHGETHYNMALLYEQLGILEVAIDHYQQFIQLSLKSHPDLISKVKGHLNYLVEKQRNKEK
jgi:superkiller protein 3